MAANNEKFEQALQNCLERLRQEQVTPAEIVERFPEYAQELLPELQAALWLWERHDLFDARDSFIDRSRRQLVAQLQRESLPKKAPVALKEEKASFLSRLIVHRKLALQFSMAVLLVITIVLGSNGIAFASQQSLPGDGLYPVKMLIENVQLAVTLDPKRDAQYHIEFARRRLSEIQALVLEGRLENIKTATSNFEFQINQASMALKSIANRDPESAKDLAISLDELLVSQGGVVNLLVQAAPEQAQPDLERVLVAIQDGQSTAEQILLAGVANTETPEMQTETAESVETPSPGATVPPVETPPATSEPQAGLPPTASASSTSEANLPLPPETTEEGGRPASRTPKPSKTPKPTKPPKSLPQPTRRPTRPENR